MRGALSPLSLLLICWSLSGAAVAVTLTNLARLDLVQTFLRREHLSLSVFARSGIAWLLLALLTAAYVDFGPVLGALFLACIGFVIRRIFIHARHSLAFTVAYAQIGAALMFSNHSLYFTHQILLFSLILIAGLLKLATP